MINLLPPQIKKEVEEEKIFKIILILGTLFLFFLLFLSLFLFLIKIYISQEIKTKKTLFEQKQAELILPTQKGFEEIIKKNNLILAQLNSFYKEQPYLTEIIEKIYKTLPDGFYLTKISLTSQLPEKRIISCRLSGFSPNRKKLIEFRENLKKEDAFKNILFPLDVWINPNDINFSVSFEKKL
jgi:Tfp pilus assembly protein PilN